YSEEKELDTPFIAYEAHELLDLVKDHLEDLKEDKEKEEAIEEIEFDESFPELEKDYELVDE
ncbi:MAG: hypothetical protein KAQ70_06615, partial [Candidatus Heimdallarchaeota archaeon]|nr:hypothetical protein [Candidatus Heimdallarchaeota archaeon]